MFWHREPPTPHLGMRRESGAPISTAAPVGAVLMLHGGRERGRGRVSCVSPPLLRTELIIASTRRELAMAGVSVWSLRFAVTGWNGDEASPVADARWALSEIVRRSGWDVPVVLVGHSMGGRTALRVAGEANVRGLVLLAPWLPPGEPMAELTDRDMVIAHGTRDRTTEPDASRRYAAQARSVARRVVHIDVPGEGHALLRRPATWNRIVVESVLGTLGLGPGPREEERSS